MRRSRLLIGLVLILIVFWLTLPPKGGEDWMVAEVVRIIDGDSILVRYEEQDIEFRLSGIDAPEYGEDYGEEATEFLSSQLRPGDAIYFTRDIPPLDVYQRWLIYGYVKPELSFEESLNSQLVRQGLAKVPDYPDRSLFFEELKRLETEARNRDLGIHQTLK